MVKEISKLMISSYGIQVTKYDGVCLVWILELEKRKEDEDEMGMFFFFSKSDGAQ